MAFSLKQAHILIVDDFQGMRSMLREFVRYMGITQIDTASNGKDALIQISNNKYDIVICDYNLGPGPNGQQVLEEARIRNWIGVSTIWVMVTAEKTTEMVMGAAEIKPDDYLLKPINQITLQSRLEKVILRKQSLGVVEEAIRTKDFGAAIAHCDKLLKNQVNNPHEILRIKSDLLLILGDDDAAKALFESVLTQRSISWAKTGLAKVHFHAHDYSGAATLLEEVLAENRMYIEAADWLAKTYEAMGDLAKAQKVLQQAIELSPNSPVRQKYLGDTAVKNGELDVAQAAFEKTIRISEFSAHKNPAVYARLAEVFANKGEPQEALNVLKRSKADFRLNPPAALQTSTVESRIHQQMGNTELALASMAYAEKLVSQIGSNVTPELLIEVAKSHFKLGNKDKACEILGDVIKNNHENAELSSQIQAVFTHEHLEEEGLTLIKASLKEVIDINNQGVILAKNGEFAKGVALLRTAVNKLPNSEAMIINLCGLLIAQMSKEGYKEVLAAETRGLLERVHNINPTNKKYYSYALALARMKRA
jgi:DNA-binding response OmpR family regulator/Tfp pilus assembly protein PilF